MFPYIIMFLIFYLTGIFSANENEDINENQKKNTRLSSNSAIRSPDIDDLRSAKSSCIQIRLQSTSSGNGYNETVVDETEAQDHFWPMNLWNTGINHTVNQHTDVNPITHKKSGVDNQNRLRYPLQHSYGNTAINKKTRPSSMYTIHAQYFKENQQVSHARYDQEHVVNRARESVQISNGSESISSYGSHYMFDRKKYCRLVIVLIHTILCYIPCFYWIFLRLF